MWKIEHVFSKEKGKSYFTSLTFALSSSRSLHIFRPWVDTLDFLKNCPRFWASAHCVSLFTKTIFILPFFSPTHEIFTYIAGNRWLRATNIRAPWPYLRSVKNNNSYPTSRVVTWIDGKTMLCACFILLKIEKLSQVLIKVSEIKENWGSV